MRLRGLATGIAVLICVSACTSGSDSDTSTPSKPKIVAPADALTMQQGRDFDLVAILPAKIDGQAPFYRGVSPDGTVFGSTSEEDPEAEQPLGGGSSLITTRDDVFLLEPKTGKVTQISDGASRTKQVGVAGIDMNGEWVTWIEVEDSFGERWTLHSYDRSTRKERVLGSYKDAVKGDTGVDFEGPKISGNQVLMSAFGFGKSSAKSSQVLSGPLDGSAPLTELVSGATSVHVDSDGMSFVDVATDALTFRDASSGESKILHTSKEDVEDYFECQLFHSRVLMTCDGSESEMNIRLTTNEGRKVSFGPFGDIGYYDLDSAWARFVDDPDGAPTIYAIDTKRMKLYNVADTQGGWDLMGHNFALVQPFDGAMGDIKLIKLR